MFLQTNYFVKLGDLVQSKKHNAIGIIVDIFGDLDPENPWICVLFTKEPRMRSWCKISDLKVLKKKEGREHGLP